jgi:hypothetical protein
MTKPELTIASNQNIFLTKPYFSITNNEIVKNSKSEQKISLLCTLKVDSGIGLLNGHGKCVGVDSGVDIR